MPSPYWVRAKGGKGDGKAIGRGDGIGDGKPVGERAGESEMRERVGDKQGGSERESLLKIRKGRSHQAGERERTRARAQRHKARVHEERGTHAVDFID